MVVEDETLLLRPRYAFLSESDGVAGELCEREPSACRRISSDEGCPNFTTEPSRQIGSSSGGTGDPALEKMSKRRFRRSVGMGGLSVSKLRDGEAVQFTGSSSFPAGDPRRHQLDRVHVHLGVPFRKRSPGPGPHRAESTHGAMARGVLEDPVKAKTGHSLLLSEAASQPVSGSAGTLATKPGCRV